MRVWKLLGLMLVLAGQRVGVARADLQAGAAKVDITPRSLPAIVNGGMVSRSLSEIRSPLSARGLVLADGDERIAIVVVDSCMVPRPLLDDAKELAAARTQIRADRMLISATHTHSAPSCMGALGTDVDPEYPPFLIDKLVEVIALAESRLEPARIGWGAINAAEYTALRRWIRRPDRVEVDPFGNRTVRANMHAGRVWDDVTGESGPEDPDLQLISVQSRSGRPLAVLANFSMHYFGDRDISADYFGLFSEGLKERLAPEDQPETAPFVAMLAHGCSGDIWRRDYTQPVPEKDIAIEDYTNGLLDLAMQALAGMEYSEAGPVVMAERRMTLAYRVPDQQRLEWAQRIVAEMGDRLPKTTTEVYAREQILLHEKQQTEIVVQGLRVGEIGIATTPCETYALTGLKIKGQSPTKHTMVIELANGGDGYIPPPEQHVLGGYNTWTARSAGLEVQAEPKIAETALQLLEQVTGAPRKPYTPELGSAASSVLGLQPIRYYRGEELAGPEAMDASPLQRHGQYELGVVFHLAGPEQTSYRVAGEVNRSPHFAGGRLRTRLPEVTNDYTIALWFWNGMPNEGRDVAGWLCSRGREHVADPLSEHVGIGGLSGHAGKLVFLKGAGAVAESAAGTTELQRWTWYHLTCVRQGDEVRLYLNGQLELSTTVPGDFPAQYEQFFVGGRCDNQANWEGRLDEIAIFDRALSAEEVEQLTSTAKSAEVAR